jgi:hypothetical protein
MFSRRHRATVDIPVRKSVLGRKLAEGLYVLQDGANVFCDVVIYNDALRSFPFDGTTGACTGFVRTLSKKFPRARILLVSSNDALVGLSRSPSLPSVDGDSADISTRLEDLRSACKVRSQSAARLTSRCTYAIQPSGSSWKPKQYTPLYVVADDA